MRSLSSLLPPSHPNYFKVSLIHIVILTCICFFLATPLPSLSIFLISFLCQSSLPQPQDACLSCDPATPVRPGFSSGWLQLASCFASITGAPPCGAPMNILFENCPKTTKLSNCQGHSNKEPEHPRLLSLSPVANPVPPKLARLQSKHAQAPTFLWLLLS